MPTEEWIAENQSKDRYKIFSRKLSTCSVVLAWKIQAQEDEEDNALCQAFA